MLGRGASTLMYDKTEGDIDALYKGGTKAF